MQRKVEDVPTSRNLARLNYKYRPGWLSPFSMMTYILMPIYILTALYISLLSSSSAVRQAPYLRVELNIVYCIEGFICLIAFSAGAFLYNFAARTNSRADNGSKVGGVNYHMVGIHFLLLAITIFGYVVFFIGAAKGGVGLIIGALHGKASDLYGIRNTGELMPGVSSLTQVGPAYIVGLIYMPPKDRKLRDKMWWGVWLLIILAALRSYIWSERLALIEVVLAGFVASAMKNGLPKALNRYRGLIEFAPVWGIFVLIIFFGGMEYFRSWPAYRTIYDDNFAQFVVDRLSLYYGLALNNGALLLKFVSHSYSHFNFSMDWFYKLPVIKTSNFAVGYNLMWVDYTAALTEKGSLEFNNPSGIFPYIYDFSAFGAPLFFFIFGWVSQLCFSSSMKKSTFVSFAYPFLFIALIEILREPYLFSSRLVYIAFGLALLSMSKMFGKEVFTGSIA